LSKLSSLTHKSEGRVGSKTRLRTVSCYEGAEVIPQRKDENFTCCATAEEERGREVL
jgi:hypothetical protein